MEKYDIIPFMKSNGWREEIRGEFNGYVALSPNHPFAVMENYMDIPIIVHGGISYREFAIYGEKNSMNKSNYIESVVGTRNLVLKGNDCEVLNGRSIDDIKDSYVIIGFDTNYHDDNTDDWNHKSCLEETMRLYKAATFSNFSTEEIINMIVNDYDCDINNLYQEEGEDEYDFDEKIRERAILMKINNIHKLADDYFLDRRYVEKLLESSSKYIIDKMQEKIHYMLLS